MTCTACEYRRKRILHIMTTGGGGAGRKASSRVFLGPTSMTTQGQRTNAGPALVNHIAVPSIARASASRIAAAALRAARHSGASGEGGADRHGRVRPHTDPSSRKQPGSNTTGRPRPAVSSQPRSLVLAPPPTRAMAQHPKRGGVIAPPPPPPPSRVSMAEAFARCNANAGVDPMPMGEVTTETRPGTNAKTLTADSTDSAKEHSETGTRKERNAKAAVSRPARRVATFANRVKMYRR